MASDKKNKAIVSKSVTAVVAILVVAGAMAWLSGVFRTEAITPAVLVPLASSRPVNTTVVQRVMRPLYTELVGSVESELRTSVASRIVANIVEMKVRAGDHVKKDQVLVVLDDRDLRSRVAQARENLKAAEAVRDLAKIELDRVNQMYQQKVASEFEVDQWRAKHLTAAADVARTQQAVSEAEVALSDAQIRSPIDGIVIDRQAEPGDQASPGMPLLTVYDPTRLRLEASLRESYIGYLQKQMGKTIPVLIESIGDQRDGVLQEIVPAADPGSRSFLVKVHLNDPSGLYPGMFGRVRLALDEAPRLEVDRSAIREVGQLPLVEVVTAQGIERRAIRLGRRDGVTVEVLAGLSEGDVVALPAESGK